MGIVFVILGMSYIVGCVVATIIGIGIMLNLEHKNKVK